jgi:hypothetical protein
MRILALALIVSGCAVWSDGAVVDYSRFINIPLTISGGGGSSQMPWEADTGYKQNRSWTGNEPWNTTRFGAYTIHNTPIGTKTCVDTGYTTLCN